MVGIPGVGKTSLLKRVVELLEERSKTVSVFSFGSLMFEVARDNGIEDRDELRKLPVSEQQKLQKTAAEKLASMTDEVVIIDTHAFISSSEGYYPGLPEHVLKIIKPTNFVSVSAKPEEVYSRRISDVTRNRDKITITNIKKELDFQSAFLSACAVISGSPIKYVLNREGKIDEAADKVINAIGL
jgi:adenylate kinase